MSQQLFNRLDAFLAEFDPAAEKSAESYTEAGGYDGSTTHPVKDVDDGTRQSQEGARSSENESDVRSDIETGGVDGEGEASAGSDKQDGRQLNIGTNQSATGEDPSSEDAYKSDKDDPGTAHPADTHDGEKYGSLTIKEAYARSTDLGNQILADIANGRLDNGAIKTAMSKCPHCSKDMHDGKCPGCGYTKKASEQGQDQGQGGQDGDSGGEKQANQSEDDEDGQSGGASGKRPDSAKQAADQNRNEPPEEGQEGQGGEKQANQSEDAAAQTFAAGYELAASLGIDKEAAYGTAHRVVSGCIHDAVESADLVGQYLSHLEKEAADAEKDPTSGTAEGDESNDDSGKEETGGSAEGGAEGGGDNGGGAPPAAPAEPAMPGEDDVMSALGGIGGGEAAPAGPEVSPDEALQELAMALFELGIDPQELADAAAAGGMGGGMEGGMEGGMGGDPAAALGGGGDPAAAMAGGGMPMGEKLAAAVKKYKRDGKFEVKEARTNRQRAIRNHMKKQLRSMFA